MINQIMEDEIRRLLYEYKSARITHGNDYMSFDTQAFDTQYFSAPGDEMS